MTDTSNEAVERLALDWAERAVNFGRNNAHAAFCTRGAATLRALLAERDAARAEAARMRDALESVVNSASPLIDYSGPGFHPVSRGEFRVEGDAMDEARATLREVKS